MTTAQSEWHCEKKGSEACIVHVGEFAVGDTFNFGVKCVRDCTYDLKVWLAPEIDLTESSRT